MMYGYHKLREIDSYVYGSADKNIWRKPSRILDQIIVAKAAYSTLGGLGDRVPLLMLEADEVYEAEQDLREVRSELASVKRELRKVKDELKQTKPTGSNIAGSQTTGTKITGTKITGSKITGRIRRFFTKIF